MALTKLTRARGKAPVAREPRRGARDPAAATATRRAAKRANTKEEYLQAIWTLGDEGGSVIGARLAQFLGVSAASVSEMLQRLAGDGLVALNDRREVRLTVRGRNLAAPVVRRHRLIERMLTDILGYEWWKTHDEAERLEHAISPEMERRMMEKLGNPDACPHGNPMPGAVPRWSQPLEQVPVGSRVALERIPDQYEHEPGFLEYLDSEGLRPGISFRLLAKDGALLIELNGRRRRIRADCGAKVWVRPA